MKGDWTVRDTAVPGLERLRMVRPEVERVCSLLASPSAEGLDRCAKVLESARADLASYRTWAGCARGDSSALAEAHHLQEAVRRASHLLQVARDYYANWSHRWRTQSSGYTHSGEAAAPVSRGLISLMA
jgi:hypothetical protein